MVDRKAFLASMFAAPMAGVAPSEVPDDFAVLKIQPGDVLAFIFDGDRQLTSYQVDLFRERCNTIAERLGIEPERIVAMQGVRPHIIRATDS